MVILTVGVYEINDVVRILSALSGLPKVPPVAMVRRYTSRNICNHMRCDAAMSAFNDSAII